MDPGADENLDLIEIIEREEGMRKNILLFPLDFFLLY